MNYSQEVVLGACLSKYGQWHHEKLWFLVSEYGSLVDLYKMYKQGKKLPEVVVKRIALSWKEEHFEAMQHDLERHNVSALLVSDNAYPDNLRSIDDRPYIIYTQGDQGLLSYPVLVSCVGTRNMSAYGRRVIDRLIGGLPQQSVCVVSGLALGIDAYSHHVALENNLPTIAVLAAGLDRYEPQTNASLGKRIAEVGCVVSEYPPGVRPQKHHFLERNRIIAALSQATIIIEGKQHSGSLVTARLALKYGREVGCPPGDIFVANSEGPHYLLRDGAWPLCSPEDVCVMLGIQLREERASTIDPVVLLLQQKPQSIDALNELLGLPMSEIYEKLTMLELSGSIEMLATGEYYAKK